MKVSCGLTLCTYLFIGWIMEPGEAFSDLNDLFGNGIETNPENAEYRGVVQDGFDMLTGNVYTIQHNLRNGLFHCTEEIVLKWNGEPSGRVFKVKCLSSKTKRSLYHINSLLLIGRADDNFCIFTSKPNEYYYKENGKWTRVAIVSGRIQDNELTSHEDIAQLTDRVRKWNDVIDQYSRHVKTIQEEQLRAIRAANEVLSGVDRLKAEAGNTLDHVMGNLAELGYVNEEQKHKIKSMIETHPITRGLQDTMAKAQNFADEQLREMTKKQAQMEGRFCQHQQKTCNNMNQAIAKLQQTQRQVRDKLSSELSRFNQKYDDLLGKGL